MTTVLEKKKIIRYQIDIENNPIDDFFTLQKKSHQIKHLLTHIRNCFPKYQNIPLVVTYDGERLMSTVRLTDLTCDEESAGGRLRIETVGERRQDENLMCDYSRGFQLHQNLKSPWFYENRQNLFFSKAANFDEFFKMNKKNFIETHQKAKIFCDIEKIKWAVKNALEKSSFGNGYHVYLGDMEVFFSFCREKHIYVLVDDSLVKRAFWITFIKKIAANKIFSSFFLLLFTFFCWKRRQFLFSKCFGVSCLLQILSFWRDGRRDMRGEEGMNKEMREGKREDRRDETYSFGRQVDTDIPSLITLRTKTTCSRFVSDCEDSQVGSRRSQGEIVPSGSSQGELFDIPGAREGEKEVRYYLLAKLGSVFSPTIHFQWVPSPNPPTPSLFSLPSLPSSPVSSKDPL